MHAPTRVCNVLFSAALCSAFTCTCTETQAWICAYELAALKQKGICSSLLPYSFSSETIARRCCNTCGTDLQCAWPALSPSINMEMKDQHLHHLSQSSQVQPESYNQGRNPHGGGGRTVTVSLYHGVLIRRAQSSAPLATDSTRETCT